jgi:hypothetical protein
MAGWRERRSGHFPFIIFHLPFWVLSLWEKVEVRLYKNKKIRFLLSVFYADPCPSPVSPSGREKRKWQVKNVK